MKLYDLGLILLISFVYVLIINHVDRKIEDDHEKFLDKSVELQKKKGF